ncbi:RidA family protein [Halanaerobiaceae bacterium Z-7014]|uniref:RidA family protein n=1 Tax=Halonatronomonas betaini TaxID=2778430 RepID=A0A931AVT1_9FIRM|nr:RidA family protein [Halonatronomonas betaini]MBF8437420.1 RidA family protein [Halonatronomonas betaini]
MERKVISTDGAPAAIGAYSQAVKAGDLVYISGQIPMTPAGELITGDVSEQTRQSLENLKAILEESGSSLEDTIKVNIYASDMDNFGAINDVYSEYFTTEPPARAFVEVAGLPKDVDVEISAVAISRK